MSTVIIGGGDPVICSNCKSIWAGRVEICECGHKTFEKTHPSNLTYAVNSNLYSFSEIVDLFNDGKIDQYDKFVNFYIQSNYIEKNTDSRGYDELTYNEFPVHIIKPMVKPVYYINAFKQYYNGYSDRTDIDDTKILYFRTRTLKP